MKNVVLLAALGLAVATGSAYADAAAGEKVFAKCKACHMIGEGAANRVGPQLNGIDGRKMASVADFAAKYGADLKAMGEAGKAWNAEELAKYVADPKAYNPGTKMAFAGVKDATDLADVVAYITSFDADGKKK